MKFLQKTWKEIVSTTQDLKDFALVIGLAFLILGFKQQHYHVQLSVTNLTSWAFLVFIIGILKPDILTFFHKTWMIFATCLNLVMSSVILTLIYIFVFTPIGFLLKFVMNKKLFEHIDKKQHTYWQKRDKVVRTKEYYQKQF